VKLSAGIVDTEVGPLAHTIDARWLMAYAAVLGETDSRYFDTRGALVAHPLFPVCYEWPAAVAARERSIPPAVYARVVHATHDLTIHRAPRAGETLRTTARTVSAVQRRPGAFVITRMETRDTAGTLVSMTDYGSLYRGVALDGGGPADSPGLDEAPAPGIPLPSVGEVVVAANLAHVYTECARIWNPIHTDLAFARAAGLPRRILHGTATLALSISRVLGAFGGDPARLRRVRCRFSGMVPTPSTLDVRAARAPQAGNALQFETACAGATVVSRGAIDLA
jgi:acyl dehydratase